MATLKQAEKARDQFADSLAALGAHAVGIEDAGNEGWVVVAFLLPGSPVKLPKSLKVGTGGTTVEVPVRIEREGAFRPE